MHAPTFQGIPQSWLAEPGHADHLRAGTGRLDGADRHARQRRPHLAAHAKDQERAGKIPQGGDHLFPGTAQQFVQRGDVGDVIGKKQRSSGHRAVLLGPRGGAGASARNCLAWPVTPQNA